MRSSTHFEIRACVLALFAYGLVAPLAQAAPDTPPVAVPQVAAAPLDPTPAVPPEIVTEVVGAAPLTRSVALTFDDGPDPRWTPQVLDLLARHGAVATFCVLGENAERHPDLVAAIVGAGMRLCDHSRAHEVDPAAPQRSMAHADLVALAGTPVDWFRAPGGVWSPSVQEAAAGAGMRPLGWSVDSRDWKRPGVEAIVRRVQQQVHPGAVVLLHDGGGRRDQTVAALERLLPWLAEHCYTTGFPDGR
jgi:peptidoglycan/xylan/chitin deacetylase (PgdA/CDA1 family)